jgi:hypothetical protein
VGRLHDGLELEKSGKLKFAFSWNLRGGVRTQGHRRSRKESPQSLKLQLGEKPLQIHILQERFQLTAPFTHDPRYFFRYAPLVKRLHGMLDREFGPMAKAPAGQAKAK